MVHSVRPKSPCGGVNNVHLVDHGWLYQNPQFHPLLPAMKTRRFTPRKLRSDAVPELIVFTLIIEQLLQDKTAQHR
jgi:hypothetical protein